jgi:methionyl-tRNA synthetase
VICPNHPDVPLQRLTERNWFFRLSAYQERLERHFAEHPDFVQPEYRRNEMLGFIRGGLEDFSISRERTPGDWGIPFPIAENGETAQREDGSWDLEAGVIYVWFDALINYITGAGFPDDPESFERWWPADLHIIGKDIVRFHSIFWPAMLWSAGLEAPRKVWVHGFLIAAGGERMSKSRGNFFDPVDFVATFGSDGARYVVLREVPFDRDAEVSWDSFVRRYNADLANDFGNLVNRTVSMTNRYLDGVRPPPRPTGGESALAEGWGATLHAYRERLEGCLLHDALAELWEYVGSANKAVDAEQPWVLAKAAKAGDDAAAQRLRGVLGDLIEACRVVGLAAAPFLPGTAPRLLGQLGHAYPYGPDGNGGPPVLEELVWGAHASDTGRVAAPEPLFPRLDVEAEAS